MGRRRRGGLGRAADWEDELSARPWRDERLGPRFSPNPREKSKILKWITWVVGSETVEMFEIYLALSDDRTEASVQLPSIGGPQTMSADELSEVIRLLAELRAGMSLTHGADPTPKIETTTLHLQHLNENGAQHLALCAVYRAAKSIPNSYGRAVGPSRAPPRSHAAASARTSASRTLKF